MGRGVASVWIGGGRGGQDSPFLGPAHLHGQHRHPQPFWCVLCVCRRGEVWGGEGGCKCVDRGRKRGTRQPVSGTCAPPRPTSSSPALLVCTVCV